MDKIEYFRNLDRTCIETINTNYTRLKNEDNVFDLSIISEMFIALAISRCITDRDFAMARLMFSQSSKFGYELFSKFNEDPTFRKGPAESVLLSDDLPLLKIYRTFDFGSIIKNLNSIGAQRILGIFAAINDNKKDLEESFKIILDLAIKKYRPYRGIGMVFEGFFNEDANLINDGILDMYSYRLKRENRPQYDDYFSLDTAAMAKLAYIKGYKIDYSAIDIPEELLIIDPLEDYSLPEEFIKEHLASKKTTVWSRIKGLFD